MNLARTIASSALAAALACCATAALAHVTLETPQAVVGTYYKAVFRVPHGCNGQATLKLRVRIPDGVIGVKPMPKPGWTLTMTRGAYAHPVAFMHGQSLAEGVREVDWSGRLLDEDYDEFVVFAFLGQDLKPGTRLYWPVVQDCASGAERWIDVPPAGQAPASLAHPAPSLELLPPR